MKSRKNALPIILLMIIVAVLGNTGETLSTADTCAAGAIDCEVDSWIQQIQDYLTQTYMGFPLWMMVIALLALMLLVVI